MIRRGRPVGTAVWIAVAVASYAVLAAGLAVTASVPGSKEAAWALAAAATLLLSAWAWLVARGAEGESARARGLRLAAVVGLTAALGALIFVGDAGPIAAPAFCFAALFTLFRVFSFWRIALIAAAFGSGLVIAPGYAYFGFVLVAIALAALPQRVGPLLREIIPERVKES